MARPLISAVIGIGVTAVIGWIAIQSHGVPYNIRELVNPAYPILSLILLAAFIYWVLYPAVALGHWLFHLSVRKIVLYLPLVWLHGTVAWVVLWLAVPMESLYDIVGTPVLAWPYELETYGRFVVLFSLLSLQISGSAIFILKLCKRTSAKSGFVGWVIVNIIALPLIYWVVVKQAATDNLTELIAHGGDAWASILLAGFIFVMGFAGQILASGFIASCAHLRLFAGGWSVAALPVAYLLLSLGTEQHVNKYGQVFSALQFLLSASRENLVQGSELLLRFCIFYSLAVVGMALITYPLWVQILRIKHPHQKLRAAALFKRR